MKAAVLALGLLASSASAGLITFDTGADGEPLDAPCEFAQTSALRALYSSIGVTFLGPGDLDGGAILHQCSSFGVDAHSGVNFLAFNETAVYPGGGSPRGPQTIVFDLPMGHVSVWIATGVGSGGTFSGFAYDADGFLVDTTEVSAGSAQWKRLVLGNVETGISRVVIEVTGHFAYVMDDLTFTEVPAPAALALAALAPACCAVRRRR
jgi:hypothetical protein